VPDPECHLALADRVLEEDRQVFKTERVERRRALDLGDDDGAERRARGRRAAVAPDVREEREGALERVGLAAVEIAAEELVVRVRVVLLGEAVDLALPELDLAYEAVDLAVDEAVPHPREVRVPEAVLEPHHAAPLRQAREAPDELALRVADQGPAHDVQEVRRRGRNPPPVLVAHLLGRAELSLERRAEDRIVFEPSGAPDPEEHPVEGGLPRAGPFVERREVRHLRDIQTSFEIRFDSERPGKNVSGSLQTGRSQRNRGKRVRF